MEELRERIREAWLNTELPQISGPEGGRISYHSHESTQIYGVSMGSLIPESQSRIEWPQPSEEFVRACQEFVTANKKNEAAPAA